MIETWQKISSSNYGTIAIKNHRMRQVTLVHFRTTFLRNNLDALFLNTTELRVDELPSQLSHFSDGLNFFLLIFEHLQGLIHSKGDGICWVAHVMHSHVCVCLVVL